MEESILQRCQEILEYQFQNRQLLRQSLTHSSVANTRLESNERLEFLGDSVLGLVVCEQLFREYEDFLEGDMTKVKSAVVSRRTCAEVADELGLADMLFLGKGVGGHGLPHSVSAALLESVIGAIYLDGGLEPAKEFILRHMGPKIQAVVANQHAQNYKSMLQQYAQRHWNSTPYYEILDEKGPDHSKAFEVAVVVAGRRFESAWGNSKKESEQLAARAALEELGAVRPREPQEAI